MSRAHFITKSKSTHRIANKCVKKIEATLTFSNTCFKCITFGATVMGATLDDKDGEGSFRQSLVTAVAIPESRLFPDGEDPD